MTFNEKTDKDTNEKIKDYLAYLNKEAKYEIRIHYKTMSEIEEKFGIPLESFVKIANYYGYEVFLDETYEFGKCVFIGIIPKGKSVILKDGKFPKTRIS